MTLRHNQDAVEDIRGTDDILAYASIRELCNEKLIPASWMDGVISNTAHRLKKDAMRAAKADRRLKQLRFLLEGLKESLFGDKGALRPIIGVRGRLAGISDRPHTSPYYFHTYKSEKHFLKHLACQIVLSSSRSLTYSLLSPRSRGSCDGIIIFGLRLRTRPASQSRQLVGPIAQSPSASNVSDVEHFVARKTELAEIHKALGSDGSRRVVVLHGLGGIGKTQLAAAYAKQHKESSTRW
ncbi:hypothetical protein DL95DRAFT_417453 [Leptodontidium sp. 2 PMI_412]|nr:hypothetical protein DL95DRAFT_417453 [Leptodontidium sp. 2 PMI_412]